MNQGLYIFGNVWVLLYALLRIFNCVQSAIYAGELIVLIYNKINVAERKFFSLRSILYVIKAYVPLFYCVMLPL